MNYRSSKLGTGPKSRGSALLFNLSYPFGKDRTYLPGLHIVASQLEKSGVDAYVCDLDIEKMPAAVDLQSYDFFGISVIGPSSLPSARELASGIYEATGKRALLGGRTVEGLTVGQFKKLFGETAVQVTSDSDLQKYMDLPSVAAVTDTSLRASLEKLDDRILKGYLEHEFSLPTDYGCIYSCLYCPAQNGTPQYARNESVMKEDVAFLAEKAKSLGIKKLDIYLGSLDLFQKPKNLERVLDIFTQERKNGMDFGLHGLSCASSFVKALEDYPQLVRKMRDAGFYMVSFGIDSTSMEFMTSQRKMHNASVSDVALDKCREVGITPGILMLTGFAGETYAGILKNVYYTLKKTITHGAVARAYHSKDFVPRNNGWRIISDDDFRETIKLQVEQNETARAQYGYFIDNYETLKDSVEKMLENPELFRNLDFQMLGTPITQPNRMHRYISNASYLALIGLAEIIGRNMNYPLCPISERNDWRGKAWNAMAEYVNSKMPFDR